MSKFNFNDPLTKDLANIAQDILSEKLEKDADDPCWEGYVQVGMKKDKSGKEVPNCVPMEEAFELPEDLQDEDVSDFVVAASAAKKAGKKKFKFGGKEFPVTIKTDIKTEGFEGCKECDIKEAVEELAELTADEKKLISQMYDKKGNLTDLGKKVMAHGKKNEETECPKCKGEGCEHCDGKGYHEQVNEEKFAGWIAMFNGKKVEIYKDKDAKDLYTAKQFAIKALKVPKSKQGLLSVEPAYEEFQVEEVVAEAKSDYDIKHKTFSSAIQHAVEVAAKRGYEVDPDDYDRKVAMGPKKPSSGKTNSYSIKLTKDGKEQRKALQVQIANLDNKFYELNMYIQ